MELIEEGAGQIRTIVGLDFSKTYDIWDTIRDQIGNPLEPRRGPFTAFVWRVVFDKDGKQVTNASGEPRVRKSNHIFCDHNGTAHLAEKLQLSLRDFVPQRVIKAERWDEVKDLHDVKLELDASTLLKYFDDALIDQKHEDENSEPKKERNKQEMTKRKRDRAARRKMDAEKEEKRWTITSMIEVGGHRLRNLQGRT
ncbi:hypothetical protein F4678DRAFT_348189 [Xylaria arbuscula]|nr:hypothetical protein F4678DRAFT_348189 [Xylaria arbuscula]